VTDALRGHLPVRQLRVMVEGLEVDRPLSRALGGSGWLDRDWVLHDVDTVVRVLAGAYLTVHGPKGAAPVRFPPLPTPSAGVGEVDDAQLAVEAELLATVNRKEASGGR
jgi:hypothetical protein